MAYKNKKGWDDALDLWGVHGVGGYMGILLLGIFATRSINPNSTDGLLHGNPGFFGVEFAAVTITAGYAFLFTYGALYVIDRFTPVRVHTEVQKSGLDAEELGEEAYVEE